MRNIYLDNAATSFPKAPDVGASMKHLIDSMGCNVKRGTYSTAYSAGEVVLETKELLCKLFNFENPDNLIFTMNITQSLNFLIQGILRPGDHCIVSSMEHNAVMRPLMQMKQIGIEFSRVPCDIFGRLDTDKIKEYIKPNTKAVIMTHASNVCGTILPLKEIGRICRENNLIFIVDTAQTAGIIDIDYKEINADAIAFTGHKGLLGPQGIGGFLINNELAKHMKPLICGGTGSDSESELQPEYMPDKFEAGTMNLPGIFGLNTSLKYIFQHKISYIREKELELTKYFISQVMNIDAARMAGLNSIEGRTAVVSLDFKNNDNGEISYLLDKDYGIKTRCGLHCAPSAHKTLETFPHGTVRFSFSHFNQKEELEYTISAINKIVKSLK